MYQTRLGAPVKSGRTCTLQFAPTISESQYRLSLTTSQQLFLIFRMKRKELVASTKMALTVPIQRDGTSGSHIRTTPFDAGKEIVPLPDSYCLKLDHLLIYVRHQENKPAGWVNVAPPPPYTP
jgi:hypothetical protein